MTSDDGCNSLVEEADGQLLVAGSHGWTGLRDSPGRPNGLRDTTLSADAVADAMTDATAMAVAGDGSILVAGDEQWRTRRCHRSAAGKR